MSKLAITYPNVLRLALPASLAALITPFLGLTDATVLGYSPRPFDVGAVGLAAAIFSLAYWTFGFLRMSTAGLTAQAIGAGDEPRARRTLAQSCGVGGAVGIGLLVLQIPFGALAFWLMTRGATVEAATITAAKDYYAIRIWGAPFVLVTYGALGWLTARGRTDLLMAIVVTMTLLNMLLDIIFVLYFDWGASGIAAGTLIAEITGGLFAALCVAHVLQRHDGLFAHWRGMDYFSARALRRLLAVNLDIFIRTLILVGAFVYFIQRSGVYGDTILSANQLLLQFFLVTGLALDGAAIAAETLTGQAIGLRDQAERRARFNEAVRKTFVVGGLGAFAMTLLYMIASGPMIELTAPAEMINAAVRTHFIWITISPLVVAAAFLMDGVYIGTTRSSALRNSMLVSGLVYIISVQLLTPAFENHGLWLAFGAFMLCRAVTLGLAWPGFALLIEQGQTDEDD